MTELYQPYIVHSVSLKSALSMVAVSAVLLPTKPVLFGRLQFSLLHRRVSKLRPPAYKQASHLLQMFLKTQQNY